MSALKNVESPGQMLPDDRTLIEKIRRGADSVQKLCSAMGVTANAVRQRLSRLEGWGYLEKRSVRQERGRPRNAYCVTEEGLRQLGGKADELAVALWSTMAAVEDCELRDQLMTRLRRTMTERFGRHVTAERLSDRMEQLSRALSGQGFPIEIVESADDLLPILRETHCPYLEIAHQDASICELERSVFSEVLGTRLELTACCRDGEQYCDFEVVP